MKQFVAITMFVVFLLLMLAGCSDRTTVPDTTMGATTEPSSTAIIEDTATPNPNETQEVTPDITDDTTPEATTVATVAPTATPKPTPTKIASPTKTPATTPEPTPRPKNPAELSKEKEREIKEAYYARSKPYIEKHLELYPDDQDVIGLTWEDVRIMKYYGTYNDCIALVITIAIDELPTDGNTEIIAGYEVKFPSSRPLYIYYKGTFTKLSEAYKAGMITKQDVYDIRWYMYHEGYN